MLGSLNQGKLEVVKQEMARVNVDILGIGKLKWTGGREEGGGFRMGNNQQCIEWKQQHQCRCPVPELGSGNHKQCRQCCRLQINAEAVKCRDMAKCNNDFKNHNGTKRQYRRITPPG